MSYCSNLFLEKATVCMFSVRYATVELFPQLCEVLDNVWPVSAETIDLRGRHDSVCVVINSTYQRAGL